jgi:PAS domain S-box-containing protein
MPSEAPVLVADNSPTFREFVKSRLERSGLEVVTAADGLEALEMARRLKPQAAFLDVVMPKIGGDRLCYYLKRLPGLERLPVILVSGACAEEAARLRAVGADVLIAKNREQILGPTLEQVGRLLQKGRLADVGRQVLAAGGLKPRQLVNELLSERNLQWQFFEDLEAGVALLDAQQRVIYLNPFLSRALGLDEAVQAAGRPLSEVLPAGCREELADALAEADQGPATAQVLVNGRWLQVTASPTRAGHAALRMLWRDVTERRLTEEALRQSEHLHRMILESIADGVVLVDRKLKVLMANAAARAYAGKVGAEMIGMSVDQAYPGARQSDFWPALEEALAGGRARQVTAQYTDPASGGRRWYELRAFPAPQGVLCITRDVTSHRRQLDLMRLERDLGHRLGEVESIEEALDLCLEAAITAGGMDGGALYLAEEDGLHLSLSRSYPPALESGLKLLPADHPAAAELRQGRPVYREHGTMFLNPQLSEAERVAAAVALPLLHQDRLIAALMLGSFTRPAVPQFQRYALESLASRTGSTLARIITQGEREHLLAELRQALSKVKQLKGLLPICASCKKIRDDSGYWQQIELYLRQHSEADFSHGICPDCRDRLYGDILGPGDKDES